MLLQTLRIHILLLSIETAIRKAYKDELFMVLQFEDVMI